MGHTCIPHKHCRVAQASKAKQINSLMNFLSHVCAALALEEHDGASLSARKRRGEADTWGETKERAEERNKHKERCFPALCYLDKPGTHPHGLPHPSCCHRPRPPISVLPPSPPQGKIMTKENQRTAPYMTRERQERLVSNHLPKRGQHCTGSTREALSPIDRCLDDLPVLL